MTKAEVLLFFSPLCPHCPPAKEAITELAGSRDDFELQLMNTLEPETAPEAARYGVRSVPTFIIKGPGHEENIGLQGGQSKDTLNKYIDIAIGKRKVEEKERSLKLGKFKFKW
jgi:thioredoxin-like negative regulator of GroEL